MKHETLSEFLKRNKITLQVDEVTLGDSFEQTIVNEISKKLRDQFPPNFDIHVFPLSDSPHVDEDENKKYTDYSISIKNGRHRTMIQRSFSFKPMPIEFFAIVVLSIREKTIPRHLSKNLEKVLGSKEFSHLVSNVNCDVETKLQELLKRLNFTLDDELYVFEKEYDQYHLKISISSSKNIKFHVDHIFMTLTYEKDYICHEDEIDLEGDLNEKIRQIKNFLEIYG